MPGNDAAGVGADPSGNRRSGPVDPPGNTTTGGEMQRCELDVGLVITLGGRRP